MSEVTMTIPEYSDAGGIDASADYFLIYQNSTNSYRKINRNTILGNTGTPVTTTATQTIQNKTLDNTNTITVKDTLFTLQDDGDVTKQARFQLSGITTGNTRVYTLPDASSSLADISSVQTLTNKTLTAPVITNGSIDNSTITVDSISGHTTPNTGTIYGLSISAGQVGTNGVITSSISSSAVTFDKVAPGIPVQVVNVLSSAVATGSTQIPLDDTIPQNSEGDEYLTLAITPKSATNILVIEALIYLSNATAARSLTAALFQDSTVNALAAGINRADTATVIVPIPVVHTLVAGTTSSTTFRIRAGANNTGTNTFNGASGARLYGAITKSSIVITEYKA